MKEVVAVLSCLLLSACSKAPRKGADPPPTPAAVNTITAGDAGKNFKRPLLTDEKITGFLRSLQDEQLPPGLLNEEVETDADLSGFQGRKSDMDAFARKWGFADYEDYLSVWGRILLAQSMLLAQQARESSSGALEQVIEDAEKQLQDENLSPDMRRLYEEQIASSKATLERVGDSSQDLPLDAADLELVKARRDEIEEVIWKHKKP